MSEEPKRLFIKRQPILGDTFKSFRKSRDAKTSWIRDGFKRRMALKDYAQSHEGKQHMRQLTRFNVLGRGDGEKLFF